MIKSMTAYGRGEVETPLQKWVVELKSVNHRFLELALNLPRRLWALEDRFRKLIKSRVARGRVDMQLSWESLEAKPMTLRLDKAVVAGVRDVLEQLRLAGSTPESLKLEHFLHFSDLLVAKEQANQDLELEAAWETVSQAVNQALDRLEEMRTTEGAALAADLAGRLEDIRREVSRIVEQAPRLPELWREKVAARLAELFPEGSPVDETRLAQEVALMAERRDVAEELARLDSHLAQFQQTLVSPEPVGRKQEFLLQEMLREVNTIGSKSADLSISQAVLEIKGSLERLREQVQNIE
ncbi:MAG: YicC family protein [Deltaproteobacteria bacterium CG07_land_8_20_14_0_80_60_11]|nr:MAG: YicC family protein [Deltaproteobacteria bacterium CG07_land_8_20_14_0_80_60_11]PJC75257.1 MAG: YicC family protein [Syntrophobacterales bacterium CG_4_8_14_3_um_filter_58_8]